VAFVIDRFLVSSDFPALMTYSRKPFRTETRTLKFNFFACLWRKDQNARAKGCDSSGTKDKEAAA
jgi:hypothetical protein